MFENFRVASPSTRSASEGQVCDCTVCEIVRLNRPPGHGGFSVLPDQFRSVLFPDTAGSSTSQHSTLTAPTVIKICSKCLSEITRGKPHNCTKGTMRENLTDIMRARSSKSKAKVTAATLKSVFEDQSVTQRGGELLHSLLVYPCASYNG